VELIVTKDLVVTKELVVTVCGSGGLFEFVGIGSVVGRNDVLIFRGGIIKTIKCGLQALQNRREMGVQGGEQLPN
jgi:hypothetical protein